MKALIKTGDTSNMPIPQYIVDTVEEMNALNKIFWYNGLMFSRQ